MPGDFDFEPDDEPVRGLSHQARRAQTMGAWSLSIGGFVVLGGGLLAAIASVLPAGDGPVGHFPGGRQVIWWGLAALAVGGATVPVRRVLYPGGLDYLWAIVGVVLGLLLAVMLVLCGLKLHDVTDLGVGGAAVLIAALVVVGGSFLRFWEQARQWGEKNDSRQRRDDREEPPWRRRKHRGEEDEDEEEDERPRRRRRRDDDD